MGGLTVLNLLYQQNRAEAISLDRQESEAKELITLSCLETQSDDAKIIGMNSTARVSPPHIETILTLSHSSQERAPSPSLSQTVRPQISI